MQTEFPNSKVARCRKEGILNDVKKVKKVYGYGLKCQILNFFTN